MLGASGCILSPQDLASGAEQAAVDARTSGEEGRAGSMLKRRMYGDLRTGGRVGGAPGLGPAEEDMATGWIPWN